MIILFLVAGAQLRRVCFSFRARRTTINNKRNLTNQNGCINKKRDTHSCGIIFFVCDRYLFFYYSNKQIEEGGLRRGESEDEIEQ